MPDSPKLFALMMFCFIGIGAVKLVSGGYLLATLESEEQVEQRARKWAASMLPRESPRVRETAAYLATGGELKAHRERFNHGMDNLVAGGYLVMLALMVMGERRARLAGSKPANASG